jgi:hypothetical protein
MEIVGGSAPDHPLGAVAAGLGVTREAKSARF